MTGRGFYHCADGSVDHMTGRGHNRRAWPDRNGCGFYHCADGSVDHMTGRGHNRRAWRADRNGRGWTGGGGMTSY